VATHDDPLNFYRFLRLTPDGGEPKQARSIPVSVQNERAEPDVSKVLKIPVGADVVHITRLLSFESEKVVFDDIYLDGALFPDLTLEMLKSSNSSLYSFFEARFGVRMIRAEERLRAVSASGMAARALNVAENSPLLLVERVAFTYGERPVEWRRGFYLTVRHHYLNLLG
jgi:GntR family transcriptional regulator